MACPLNGVEGVEIVWDNARIYENFREIQQSILIVIDPFQEYRLIEDGYAETLDFLHSSDDLSIQFFWVVRMNDKKDLFRGRGQKIEEGVVDPFWYADGETGVKADPFQMGDLFEGLK